MKTKVTLFILLLVVALAISANQGNAHRSNDGYFTFLPNIFNGPVYIIDCIDEHGNLVPCPIEEN